MKDLIIFDLKIGFYTKYHPRVQIPTSRILLPGQNTSKYIFYWFCTGSQMRFCSFYIGFVEFFFARLCRFFTDAHHFISHKTTNNKAFLMVVLQPAPTTTWIMLKQFGDTFGRFFGTVVGHFTNIFWRVSGTFWVVFLCYFGRFFDGY